MKTLLRAVLGSLASAAGWWVGDQFGLGLIGAFALSTLAWGAGDFYAVRLYGQHF